MAGDDDRSYSQREEALFDRLERVINKTVKRVCTEQVDAGTEEPALTSRLGQAIKSELRHHPLEVDGMRVQVATQDIPSHGPGALERETGVDLYISVIREDEGEQPVSKGILTQSKTARELQRGHKRLRNQCNRMKHRSEESYVIVFDKHDAVAVPAERARYPKLPDDFRRDEISVGELMVDGLRCRRGDRNIGRDPDKRRAESMREEMEKLKAHRGMSLLLKKT